MPQPSPRAVDERMTRFITAWQTIAPDKSFGGMTLAQFKARLKPSQDARAAIQTLDDQMTMQKETRDASDKTSMDAMDLVVNGVRADPTVGGDDGALYKALGYTVASEKQSGLTRKKKPADPPK